MMKAAVIERYGGNEVVEVREVPRPAVGAGELLIRVQGASVNPVDWKVRSGQLKILTGHRFPKILGSECAGEVVETGAGVQTWRKGDPVVGFPGIRRLGAFAEYVGVKQSEVFRPPANLPPEAAATLPIAGLTALQALRDVGRLGAGQKVLVNGASGGVGTFAVQIARVIGANVTAVCSAGNAALVRELGADRVIDYTREDFTRGGESYDVVFDAVAKRTFGECRRVLTSRGIYVSTLPSRSVLLNQYLTGFLSAKKARTIMVRPNAADMEWMRAQIESGALRPVIDRVFSLEEIREAFAYSESGRARGKVVLRVG